jgi:adenylate cyclase
MSERKTILIVDDELPNRILLNDWVETIGQSAVLADNGLEALALARQKSPDLILLDMMMPVMGGLQVLHALKADPALCHVPVIIISAADDMEQVIACIREGAEDYLNKPFNPELLRARITSSLRKLDLLRSERRLREQMDLYLVELKEARRRSDALLSAMLPDEKVAELKETGRVKPRRHENVAILFADVVGFTSYCDRHEPEEVVSHLREMVEAFERIVARHELEKVKTIGDAFMAAGGLLKAVPSPAAACVRAGLEMLAALASLPARWQLRIGVHVGPVVAGVVGGVKYQFDIFGDTVNTAARIQNHATPGSVCASMAAWAEIAHLFRGESLGPIEMKGKGKMEIVRVDAANDCP